MADLHKEKYTEKATIPVTIQGTEIILDQMKNYICKIHKDGKKGTGFFCKIPFPDKFNLLKVLVTNNHILNEKDIAINKEIIMSLNDDKIFKSIKIDNSRKKFSSKELDVTFIEIQEEKDNIDKFLEIDDKLLENAQNFKGFYNDIYSKKSIYILNYPEGNNIVVSYGLLKDIQNETYISHYTCTKEGSSGSPILSLNNFRVIGIHCGSSEKYNYNKGIFIKYPIDVFYKETLKFFLNRKNENKNKSHEDNMINDESKINDIKNNDNKISEFENNKNDDSCNEIIIFYYINQKDEKIKIFGEKFVENNKDNCTIIYDEKEAGLFSEFYLDQNIKNKGVLEIKLKKINTITNMNSMFKDCSSLISLIDIENFDTSEVTDIEAMFYGCKSLQSLPDISKWNTTNFTKISSLFGCCSNLKSLPDISKWDTSKVKNMEGIFMGCSSLLSLPDISKWNTKNVEYMAFIFGEAYKGGCSSLIELPDISKWDTTKVFDIKYCFAKCSSLISLPNIGKWNMKNVRDISGMFLECSSLIKCPDISKWDINNVIDMKFLFYKCSKLGELSDISQWKTNNVTDITKLFFECSSLLIIPDISNWNTSNITKMSGIFCGCKQLLELPDISKWDTKNVTDISLMFSGCEQLQTIPDISIWNMKKIIKKDSMFNGCKSLLSKPKISKSTEFVFVRPKFNPKFNLPINSNSQINNNYNLPYLPLNLDAQKDNNYKK